MMQTQMSNSFINNNTFGSRQNSNDKLDVWKVLIRDDANRFVQEQEDKKLKKKIV
jgi:hypothetical protein